MTDEPIADEPKPILELADLDTTLRLFWHAHGATLALDEDESAVVGAESCAIALSPDEARRLGMALLEAAAKPKPGDPHE